MNRRLPTSRAKPVGDHRRLVGGHLEYDGATRRHPLVGTIKNRLQILVADGPGPQRFRRLPLGHDGGKLLIVADVWRIGDEHIDRTTNAHRQRIEPQALVKTYPAGGSAEPGEVGPGHGECIGRSVGGKHPCGGTLGGDGETERTGSGTEIGDHHLTSGAASSDDFFDRKPGDELGLRPRDQHPSVDHEIEVAESPPADDVLEGLAVLAAGDQSVERGDAAHGRRGVEHTVELARLAAGDLFDDATGIDRGDSTPLVRSGWWPREQLGPGDGASRSATSGSRRSLVVLELTAAFLGDQRIADLVEFAATIRSSLWIVRPMR